jgi:hypothetical protein
MVNYKEKYGYGWIEPLISYCSDPFHKFQEQRIDRASLVLFRLVDHNLEEGLIERDETIRKQFIDSLVEGIKADYDGVKTAEDFKSVRRNIESIVMSANP